MSLPLVTRTDYKVYAGLTSPTQDAKIDQLIILISEFVKNICRRSFVDYVSTSKVEIHNGGAYYLIPEEYPVIAVTSLELSEDFGNTYTTLVEYTDYALDKQAQNISSTTTLGFPYRINGYKLTYTAGYTTIPEDLKLAVFDLITYYIKNDMAVHSNKAPGTSSVQVEYITTTNLPAHIKRVLDLHTANYA